MDGMSDVTRKLVLLISELHGTYPQLANEVLLNARESVIRVLMRKHGLEEKEFDDELLIALEPAVQALRSLQEQ